MEYLLETTVESAFTILLRILSAAVTVGGAMFVHWLKRKVKNDTLNEYTGMLVFYAQQAVMAVAQAEADVLKAAASDGKLTEEEKRQMKAAAMSTLKAMAPDAILKFMERANSDIDTLLGTLIEAAVHDNNGGV